MPEELRLPHVRADSRPTHVCLDGMLLEADVRFPCQMREHSYRKAAFDAVISTERPWTGKALIRVITQIRISRKSLDAGAFLRPRLNRRERRKKETQEDWFHEKSYGPEFHSGPTANPTEPLLQPEKPTNYLPQDQTVKILRQRQRAIPRRNIRLPITTSYQDTALPVSQEPQHDSYQGTVSAVSQEPLHQGGLQVLRSSGQFAMIISRPPATAKIRIAIAGLIAI